MRPQLALIAEADVSSAGGASSPWIWGDTLRGHDFVQFQDGIGPVPAFYNMMYVYIYMYIIVIIYILCKIIKIDRV